jgi:MFS family permease
MFSLINWIEVPIVKTVFGEGFFVLITFAEVAISGIFAFVGGLISDLVGRKRIIILGFVMLGIEYAVLSFFRGVAISGYVYVFLDGISWGLFSVAFFIVLWGDLAKEGVKEKYYVIGGLPYLLSGFLQVVVGQYIESINVSTAFSLASFFLFLAILPLIYAPETLPEKRIQERQIKKYAEEAKKVVEREARKK